jgi:hypothetical protein
MKRNKAIYDPRSEKREKAVVVVLLFFFCLVLVADSFASNKTNSSTIKNKQVASVEKNDSNSIIRWKAATGGKYHFYLIERTRDKVHYEFVSIVKSSNIDFYSVTDHNPENGNVYYRISATDLKNQPLQLFEVSSNTTL